MQLLESFRQALGLNLEPNELTFLHMTLRGIIVFFASLVMLRLSEKRFLPHKTAFDAILFFILASMLSRAINGSAAFFPTLGAGFMLVGLHRLIAKLSCRHHGFGNLVKGTETVLLTNGVIMTDALHGHSLSKEDLLEALRINGNVSDPARVQEARYERSGEISVVKKD